MNKLARTTVLTAMLGAGAVIGMTTTASAEVVCNRHNECWRVSKHYDSYPPALGVHFYDDKWYEHHRHEKRYTWREDRDDGGYYDNGNWVTFEVHEHH